MRGSRRQDKRRSDVHGGIGALAPESEEPELALEAFRAALRLESDPAERAALEQAIAELAD